MFLQGWIIERERERGGGGGGGVGTVTCGLRAKNGERNESGKLDQGIWRVTVSEAE